MPVIRIAPSGVAVASTRSLPFEPSLVFGTDVSLASPGVDVHRLDPYINRLTAIIGQRFQYAEKADKTKDARITKSAE